MSDQQAYEIQGLRPDGSVFTGEVLGEQSAHDAKRLAQHYADLWNCPVKLYRVPFVHIGSAPWAEDQMNFICAIEPKEGLTVACEAQTGSLLVQSGNPHMWVPYNGPEPYDEVCHLCGVFSGAHHKRPDPPAASLPCPEPWPEWPDERTAQDR